MRISDWSSDVCSSDLGSIDGIAGLRMLLAGGNAIDAALAAAITLTVVEPVMNGLGGDAFALVWDKGRLHGLNASGRAPQAWKPEPFAGQESMPQLGWDTVTVQIGRESCRARVCQDVSVSVGD